MLGTFPDRLGGRQLLIELEARVKLSMPRWYAIALTSLLVATSSCSQVQSVVAPQSAASPVSQASRAVTVSVQPVRQGPISLVLIYSGTIQPVQQLGIAPRTAGRIEKVHVDVGSSVKAGDKLVTLDRTLLESSVRQAEAGVAVAQARLESIKAGPRAEDVAQAEATLTSAKAKLQQVKNGPTGADLEAANSSVASAQLAVQRAQTDLQKLKAAPTEDDLRAAQLNIDKAKNSLSMLLEDTDSPKDYSQICLKPNGATYTKTPANLNMP